MFVYDKEFRLHISKHPERSWVVILQQAWSMKLKDRLYKSEQYSQNNQSLNNNSYHRSPHPGHSSTQSGGKSSDACHRYNRGRCTFGPKCHFDHKCSYCGKFGHTVLNCRKLLADKDRAASGKREFVNPNNNLNMENK